MRVHALAFCVVPGGCVVSVDVLVPDSTAVMDSGDTTRIAVAYVARPLVFNEPGVFHRTSK